MKKELSSLCVRAGKDWRIFCCHFALMGRVNAAIDCLGGMMRNGKTIFVALILLLSRVGLAEQLVAAASAPAESKVIGVIDLRPSWTTKTGGFTTENVVEVGYQFSPIRTLSYAQDFYTNVFNPADIPAGTDFKLGDGFVRTRLSKLYDNSDLGLSLSYQNRLYFPTSLSSQNAGMIAKVRNYVTLKKSLSSRVSLSVSELPILHLYSRAGNVTADGPAANSVFENRVYAITDISITGDLSFSIPIMFHQTRSAKFEGAANSETWSFFLWTYPEVTYAVTPNTSLGIAYYSGNLVAADLSGVAIASGLEKGVVQLVFGATL